MENMNDVNLAIAKLQQRSLDLSIELEPITRLASEAKALSEAAQVIAKRAQSALSVQKDRKERLENQISVLMKADPSEREAMIKQIPLSTLLDY